MPVSQPTNFVIAVSSVSGGGKTTLVKKTVELLAGVALFFDDYAAVSKYPSDMKKWVEHGADVNAWQTPQFASDLAALRNGESIISPLDGATIRPAEFIVIEEPMGRERAEMRPHIDFVAVIDTSLEIALARRLLRDLGPISLEEVEAVTKEELAVGIAKIVTHLRDYLSGYLDSGRALYAAVQEQAKATCDLGLDGALPADELARQLVTAVRKKSGRS